MARQDGFPVLPFFLLAGAAAAGIGWSEWGFSALEGIADAETVRFADRIVALGCLAAAVAAIVLIVPWHRQP